MSLNVSDELERNAKSVQGMGGPGVTRAMLIEYMCQRLGVPSLEGMEMLDLGCGFGFSRAIINRNLPVGRYAGFEIEKRVVDFLQENVDDPRRSYRQVDVLSQRYNRIGKPLILQENV